MAVTIKPMKADEKTATGIEALQQSFSSFLSSVQQRYWQNTAAGYYNKFSCTGDMVREPTPSFIMLVETDVRGGVRGCSG